MNYGVARAEKRGGGVSKNIDGMLAQSRTNLSKQGVSIEVYSAIREELLDFNATDQLINLANFLNKGNKEEAIFLAKSIQQTTTHIIEHNYQKHRFDEGLHDFINTEFSELLDVIEKYDGKKKLNTENDYSFGAFSIMGFGEIFRAKLQVYLLTNEGKNAIYIDPYEVEGVLENLGDVLDFYKDKISVLLEDNKEEEVAIVVPGFVPYLKGGINGMIGRGFTDTITGLVSLALLDSGKFENVIFELQKDVNGVMSANPKELENGLQRVRLLREISTSLAKKLFRKDGAHSQLLNKATLNSHVIKALEEYDNYSIEILNPSNPGAEKTTIKKEVFSSKSGIQIIASRKDIPNKHRQGLGVNGAESLYLLGEDVQILENHTLIHVSKLLQGLYGVSYFLNGNDMIVVNFVDDYDPRKDRSLSKEDRLIKYNEIIKRKGSITTASDKRFIALDILHTELMEKKSEQDVAEVA